MAKKNNETEEIFVPRASDREQPTMFIGVNGKNYFLPRGQKVTVPKAVAYEFYRAMEAQNMFDQTKAELEAHSK